MGATTTENATNHPSADQVAPISAYAGIFASTAGILMLEILLTRIFSFTIWYHLAYLTISTALLSFGAAGSVLAAVPRLLAKPGRLAGWTAVAAAVSLLAGMWYLGPRPLDPALLFEEPAPFFFGLLKYYLVLCVPFLLGGIAVAVPLAAYPAQVNRLYAADLAGAASGCGAAVAALTWTNGAAALSLAAVTLIVAGVLYVDSRGLRWAFAGGAIVLSAALPWADDAIAFRPSPSKALGMVMDRDDFELLFTRWSPVNRVDVSRVANAFPGGYWALGVRQYYKGKLPRVMNITYDGHNGSNMYRITGPDTMAFLDYHILRTPYLFLEEPEVLVIGVGGGVDVHNALRRNASHVTGAELQPITIQILQDYYADYSGDTFNRPDVTLVAAEGRHFVRSHDAVYDLIQITATDTFSAQATGAYVLAESYLYTIEAMEDYLTHLSEDGIFCIVLGDIRYDDASLPSPLATRLVLTAQAALWRQGVSDPAAHLLVASPTATRGGMRSALVVKKSPFTGDELARAHGFVEEIGVELRVASDIPGHAAMTRLTRATPDELPAMLEREEFHLAAITDDQPFFFHILRWRSLFSETGALWYFPGSATGQIVLLMMLVQALVVGAALILLPLLVRSREALTTGTAWRFLPYFLALGIGFMLIEISFVQKYVLFLGYPTYSLSVTIVSLLVFAALGAYLSWNWWSRPRQLLTFLLAAVTLLVIVEIFALPSLRSALLGTPLITRILLTGLFQCPLGICLGMFFPTGIELLRRSQPSLVPWAWAVNGIGSVAGTVLAVILGMAFGFSSVALIATALYIVGAVPVLMSLTGNAASRAA